MPGGRRTRISRPRALTLFNSQANFAPSASKAVRAKPVMLERAIKLAVAASRRRARRRRSRLGCFVGGGRRLNAGIGGLIARRGCALRLLARRLDAAPAGDV